MTGAQASYPETLTEEVGEPAVLEPDLDEAEASKRIDAPRREAGRREAGFEADFRETA